MSSLQTRVACLSFAGDENKTKQNDVSEFFLEKISED